MVHIAKYLNGRQDLLALKTGDENFKQVMKMKSVYMLTHSRIVVDDARETKVLGYFSTQSKAKQAIDEYKLLDGFCDYPNDFFIETCEADVDEFNDIPGQFSDVVYRLFHEYYDGVEFDYVTNLGFYSTEQNVYKALEKFKHDPIFAEHLDGFIIYECQIDEKYWQDGFFTYYHPES